MKIPPASRPRHPRGYISYCMVLSFGMLATLMMLYTYDDAMNTQLATADIQMRLDYRDREEAVMRALLNSVPNAAIGAMKGNSNLSSTTYTPLQWQSIFSSALGQANARTALTSAQASTLGITNTISANGVDSTLSNTSAMFTAISPETTAVSAGVNRSLGANYPVPLNTDSATAALDCVYPIIANTKVYGALASGLVGLPVATYPNFNLIPYPNISFGYGTPGQNFVAQQNWWAFSMSLAANDTALTKAPVVWRNYVMSIYEVPSQLAISSDAYTTIGQFTSGSNWQNVTINGNVFAGNANVVGTTALSAVASRRGLTVSSTNTIGGQTFTTNPFAPGKRETYLQNTGTFYPVSMPSESGRTAFIPINPGMSFFDRYSVASESNSVSPTTWNKYSCGCLQCAMYLDVIAVTSSSNQTPTQLRFTYLKNGSPVSTNLTINNTSWQSNNPPYPFGTLTLPSGQTCIAVYPTLFPAFLAWNNIKGDPVTVNNSIAVDVDYTVNGNNKQPSFPCVSTDTAVVLEQCHDLSSFTKGFSLVTNMRLYIGDNFNIVTITPPSGLSSPFYPPASLFAPDKRYGTSVLPYSVNINGQVGNLASDTATTPVGILDTTLSNGVSASAQNVTMNLSPLTHPAMLPPIYMMNWLVVLSEIR